MLFPIIVTGFEHAIRLMHHGYTCWYSHRAALGTHLHYRCTFR